MNLPVSPLMMDPFLSVFVSQVLFFVFLQENATSFLTAGSARAWMDGAFQEFCTEDVSPNTTRLRDRVRTILGMPCASSLFGDSAMTFRGQPAPQSTRDGVIASSLGKNTALSTVDGGGGKMSMSQ